MTDRLLIFSPLLAFAMGLACGVFLMDIARDRREAQRVVKQECPVEEALHCSIAERTGIQFCVLSKGDQ